MSSSGKVNSNWKALKAKIQSDSKKKSNHRGRSIKKEEKAPEITEPLSNIDSLFTAGSLMADSDNGIDEKYIRKRFPGGCFALDCEMVGVGSDGADSVLARISVVDFSGKVVLDDFVRPSERVTDFRTWVSGVKPQHVKSGKSLSEIQKAFTDIVKPDSLLVGHGLKNDFKVLMISHPRHLIRDTSKFKEFKRLNGNRTPSLKKLSKIVLGLDIQGAEHSSVEDAKAAMLLYRSHAKSWELNVKKTTLLRQSKSIQ